MKPAHVMLSVRDYRLMRAVVREAELAIENDAFGGLIDAMRAFNTRRKQP